MRPLERIGSVFATNAAILSIATRICLGAFPILFVLVLRWTWGKEAFDFASAAINWSSYLNALLLSGFALVPPAVVRLRAAVHAGDRTISAEDRHTVRDHVALSHWLLLIGAAATFVLGLTVDRAFGALARESGETLRWWFLLFSTLTLSQIPLALWLGVAQASGRYRIALVLVALPRAFALILLPALKVVGMGPGFAIAVAIALPIMGQLRLGVEARRALVGLAADSLIGKARLGRILPSNINAGIVTLVSAAVTILPVTLVGRFAPNEVGVAFVIVAAGNALTGIVVAAFFPLSLGLVAWLNEPRGVTRYCFSIARRVGCVTLIGLLVLSAAGILWLAGFRFVRWEVMLTAALVLAATGLRLGALGTQHVAMYKGLPHLNMVSAATEAVASAALLLVLLPRFGLPALGAALFAGAALRIWLALGLELRWLKGARN